MRKIFYNTNSTPTAGRFGQQLWRALPTRCNLDERERRSAQADLLLADDVSVLDLVALGILVASLGGSEDKRMGGRLS
jgi:hypothetical protein